VDSNKVELSRSEKRRLEFQERIKEAALRLFKKNGISNTSVASIIKEADIAHKTFFNHFPSKDHLLEFLVSESMHQAFGGIEFGERPSPPQQSIEESFLEIASSMEEMDQGFKEVVSYYFIGIEGPKEIRHEHTNNFYEYVHAILSQAKKEGSLRPGYSIDSLTDIVVGLYASTIMNWVSHDNYPLIKKMKAVIRFVNDTVFSD